MTHSASGNTTIAPQASFPDIVTPLIPHGSICTLAGASGVGKTAMLAGLIAALQRGESWWGLPTHQPPAIGYLACDRPWRDHAKWFEKAGAAPFPHYSMRDVPYNWNALRVQADVPALFGGLVDNLGLPPGALLVVDPVSLFLPGRLHDYKDMAIGMGLLDAQLKARHLTLLGVFHVGKQKGMQDQYTRPKDRILGSAALLGYSETAFYLLDPSDTQKRTYTLGISSHQSKELEFQYTRDSNGLFIPADFFDRVQEEEQVLSFVPLDGSYITTAMWLSLIRKQFGCSGATAERYIRDLKAQDRVVKAGHGKYKRAIIQ